MGPIDQLKTAVGMWSKKISRNSYLNCVAIFVTIFGFYLTMRPGKPQLCAFVGTDRAVVYSSGTTSLLKVSVNGEPVKSDISAAQIWIWNQGKSPIRNLVPKDGILDQFAIETSPNVPIIEAKVLNQTRPVVGFDLVKDEMGHGKLSAKWSTLETDDGVRLQILYAGPPTTHISVTATPAQQPEGVIQFQRDPRVNPAFGDWVYRHSIFAYAVLGAWLIGLVMIWVNVLKPMEKASGFARIFYVFCLAWAAIASIAFLLELYIIKIPHLPLNL